MKVIKQKTLYFSEGKSDKVYEVDLCESGSDLYVVNFRYGRRGATLRDGTKTVFPVAYEDAIKVYDSLISSKEKKGYSESLSQKEPNSNLEPDIQLVNSERNETIIKYLESAIAGTYSRNWKISRVIWRAATLNIFEAAPLVAHFITSNDSFEQYAAIYALTQFKANSHIPAVQAVFNTNGFENKVGRIAASYILKFGNSTDTFKVTQSILEVLPEQLKNNLDNNHAILNALSVYILKDKDVDASFLYYIYLFSQENETLSAPLYNFIEKVPVKVNTFKSLRYIYRASHLFEDYTFLALISKKIGVSKPGYSSSYLYINTQWSTSDVEKKKPNPSIAFSKKTKDYFNKHTYKLVYELSKNNTTDYVRYAVALLTSISDKEDFRKEEIQYNYQYNAETERYESIKTYYPKYHDFLALMYILYGGSSRLQRKNNKWFYTEAPDVSSLPREEALPEIWNTKPAEVLQILAEAKSEEAVRFALRIIQDNNHFLDDLTTDVLRKLVSHYHPEVLHLILNIIEAKYVNTKPDRAILIALLESQNQKAIDLGLTWLKQYEAQYFASSNFIIDLILSGQAAVILYLKTLYKQHVAYKKTLSVSELEALFVTPQLFSTEYLILVNDLIGNTHFGSLLKNVSEEKIASLASSPATTNKLFAANLAKHNTAEIYVLFKSTIDSYINSDDALLRQVGIELLSHFPIDFLLKNHQKISAYCFSEYGEVRKAIQPTIEKLIALETDFKNNLFNALLQSISSVEYYDGLHQNSYTLLTNSFKDQLKTISKSGIFELVLSQYEYAQKLGLPLYKDHINLNLLEMSEVVDLTNSSIFEIRESIHQYFKSNIHKVNYELEDALLIFNSAWDDVVQWGCDYFGNNIKASNWTVDLLLYASDHTKPEVQAFGRKMITSHFSEDKGLPLLLKLQEHPTKSMQFFVTNYLDNYAKDNVAVILKLEQFFKTSLFNINTHRATKTRIYTFLEQESIKDKDVAAMTVRLIEAVLGTKTKIDQSHHIDMLLTISETHADLKIPLIIKTY